MKSNKKQVIRLTESDLHRIVRNSVKKMLREGDGKFADLYNDKNAPHTHSDIISDLIQQLQEAERNYHKTVEDIQHQIENYTNWDWDEFCDYAYEKYGLTMDNLNKNWDNFCQTR